MLEQHVLTCKLKPLYVPFYCDGFSLGIHDQIGSRMKQNLGHRSTQISMDIAGGYFCRTPPCAMSLTIERL